MGPCKDPEHGSYRELGRGKWLIAVETEPPTGVYWVNLTVR